MAKRPPVEDKPLQCPRCIKKMRKQRHLKAVIDHCDGCQGNFFDEGEMLSVLGKTADPEVWTRSNRMRTPSMSEITCPRCHQRMQMHPMGDEALAVDVDFCLGCGGIWLDGGEVDAVMQIGARALANEAKNKKAKAKASTLDTPPGLMGKYLSLFPKP